MDDSDTCPTQTENKPRLRLRSSRLQNAEPEHSEPAVTQEPTSRQSPKFSLANRTNDTVDEAEEIHFHIPDVPEADETPMAPPATAEESAIGKRTSPPRLSLSQSRIEEPSPVVLPKESPAIAEPSPAEEVAPEKSNVSDMLDQAANGQAAYTQLQYDGDLGKHFLHWLGNLFVAIIAGPFLYPILFSRNAGMLFRNVNVNGETFSFQPKIAKACFFSTLSTSSAIGAYLCFAFQPFEQAHFASAGLALFAWALIPFVLFEIGKSKVNGLRFRDCSFSFDGGIGFHFSKYFFIPLVSIAIGVGTLLFTGSPYGFAAMLLLLLPLLMSDKEFLLNHSSFGTIKASFEKDSKAQGSIYTKPILFGILLHAAIAGGIYAIGRYNLLPGFDPQSIAKNGLSEEQLLTLGVTTLAFYSIAALQSLYFFWAKTYIRQGRARYYLEQTSIGKVQFVCAYSANSYFWLSLTNLLIKSVSCGLFTPLASYRHNRYLVENIALIANEAKIENTYKSALKKKEAELDPERN